LTTGFGLNVAKNLVEGFVNSGASVLQLSRTINENVETLGVWQEAVKRVGGTAEGFNATVAKLYDRINNAVVKGDPELFGVLGALGINPKSGDKIKVTTTLIKEMIAFENSH
jgi:hypothetical protein